MKKHKLTQRSHVRHEDLMDTLLAMVPDRVYSDQELSFLTSLHDYGINNKRTFALAYRRNRAKPKKLIPTNLLGLHDFLDANKDTYSCQDRFFLSNFLKAHPILSYQNAYDLLHHGYRREWIHAADKKLILQGCQAQTLDDFDKNLEKLRKLMKK